MRASFRNRAATLIGRPSAPLALTTVRIVLFSEQPLGMPKETAAIGNRLRRPTESGVKCRLTPVTESSGIMLLLSSAR